MNDMDLSRLPTGSRGWTALATWAASSDDREERYFLELKSVVDLAQKHGRHKVAKFILGAANRDPVKAAKRFGGHAVMLLGVSEGSTSGIPPFEAQDLEREIRKFTGASGPNWDFERIHVGGENDVIAIIVDPPTSVIWPCLADGEGMTNGDIYIRGDGRTEKATGGEIQAMLGRLAAVVETVKLPKIGVEILGEVLAISFDPRIITAEVESLTKRYMNGLGKSASLSTYGIGTTLERRSEGEFRRQVEKWRSGSVADPASALHDLAAGAAAAIRLRVTNPVTMSLRDVRIDIEFDEGVRALDWKSFGADGDLELFPDRPLSWGRDSPMTGLGMVNFAPLRAEDTDGTVQIVQSEPAKLSLSLKLLHAKGVHHTGDEEIVLVLFMQGTPPPRITAKWRLTAGDVHDIREDVTEVSVNHRDWSAAIGAAISRDQRGQ
jgi:hypothetical protein